MGPSLTKSVPKVLHLVAGRPMLAHVLDAVSAGTTGMPVNIVVVVGHGANQVQEMFPSGASADRSLRFVEQSQQLGTARLKRWLKALSNDNEQREYYLTDVIAQAVAERCRVIAVECSDSDETRGVNSKEQLAIVERIAQRRVASELMECGTTLADPALRRSPRRSASRRSR